MRVVTFDGRESRIYKVADSDVGDLQMILEAETPEEVTVLERLAKTVSKSEWVDEMVGNDGNPQTRFFLKWVGVTINIAPSQNAPG